MFGTTPFHAKPRGTSLCYECDAELVGPFCPKCNPRTAPGWQWLLVGMIGAACGSAVTVLFL